MSDREAARACTSLGLRERRRIRTKQLIQVESLKLFAARGYDQTTVDDIAHAAAISPRTFFRYFATKEDVALWDEYDDHPFQRLWKAPSGDDPMSWLIAKARTVLEDFYRNDKDLLLARVTLSFTVPAIRARFLDSQIGLAFGPSYTDLVTTLGGDPDDMRLRVRLGAFYAAMLIAVERWQHNEGRDDLLQLYDEAISALTTGLATAP
jgi:AcrR family transcriptional regulator